MENRFDSGPVNRFVFWQQWLVYSSIFIALIALIYAMWPGLSIFESYNVAVAKALWNEGQLSERVVTFRNFIYGPLGGTMSCAYLLLAFIAAYPFRKKERWARNAIAIAFGVWFVADSWICFRAEVYFQIYMINVISFLQKLLPLVFTWKYFPQRPENK